MADGGCGWDVFLAYAGPDRAWARSAFEAISAAGVRVCFDRVALQPGDNWYRLLQRWVRESSIVVALLSANSEDAHYQHSELAAAIEMGRREGVRLVPVRLAPNAWIPYGIEQLQSIDMFTDADVADVAERIAALVPSRQGGDGQLRSHTAALPLKATQVFSYRVPVRPRYFIGRQELLERLGRHLHPDAATVVTQTIEGLGGVGKTSLAAALVEEHRHHFDIVWWVRAEEESTLAADLAALGPHLGLPSLDNSKDLAAAVRRALESTDQTWLVVYDNAPDQHSIAEWLPRRGVGSVVITSRSSSFPDVDEVIEVDAFPHDVAERFLRRRVQQRNPAAAREDLEDVLDRLGGLPLALEQAGAWVAEVHGRSFAGFVQLYDNAAKDPFPDGTRPIGYEHTATTTWRISIQAATDKAPLADRVMPVLGFMAPGAIPRQWLRDMADDGYLQHTGPDVIDDAIDALATYSLVIPTDIDTISIHRVLQLAARRTAPATAAVAAEALLATAYPGDPDHPDNWAAYGALAPHVQAVWDQSNADRVSTDVFRRVVLALARYFERIGQTDSAIRLAHEARESWSDGLGEDHPHTLAAAQRQAAALPPGHPEERGLAEDILARRQRTLGNDHPDTLASANNLALALADLGEHQSARLLDEETIARRRRVLGENHPHTLHSATNLGDRLAALGEHHAACTLHEDTLARSRRHLGDDHPDTLRTASSLALDLANLGELQEARTLAEDTLARYQNVLSKDHPATLAAASRLATILDRLGECQQATKMAEDIFVNRRRVLGIDHPDTHISANLLAMLARRSTGDDDSQNTST